MSHFQETSLRSSPHGNPACWGSFAHLLPLEEAAITPVILVLCLPAVGQIGAGGLKYHSWHPISCNVHLAHPWMASQLPQDPVTGVAKRVACVWHSYLSVCQRCILSHMCFPTSLNCIPFLLNFSRNKALGSHVRQWHGHTVSSDSNPPHQCILQVISCC